jgi:hypothetical protein
MVSSNTQCIGEGIAQRGIACQPFLVHSSQHWHQHIRVIVNLAFLFILMESVETAHILLER